MLAFPSGSVSTEMTAELYHSPCCYYQRTTILTLEEMSHAFYLSSRQLNRILLQCYHTTITAYLKNLRYNTALAYMEKGGMTLREIAAECGFTDYQQLRRMIQKQKGPETPMI